jgi:hypothetical protein
MEQALGNAPDAHEIVDVLHLLMAADLPEKGVPEVRATVFGTSHPVRLRL